MVYSVDNPGLPDSPAMRSYRHTHTRVLLAGFALLLLITATVSLAIGAISTGFGDVFSAIGWVLGLNDPTSPASGLDQIIVHIRLPRLVLGLLVGAGLAMSGTVMQALFRNPMADPGLLGVSSGAALGAVSAIVLGVSVAPGLFAVAGGWLLPAAAFCGSLLSLWLVHRLARFNYRTDVATMLLAGVAVNAIAGALIGLLSYIASDAELRDLIFWSLGSLEIADWWKLFITAVIAVPCCVVMLRYSGALNANLLGESEARHLGFDIERIKGQLIVLVAMVVGVLVAMSGVIGFVGLLVPHLLRLVFGPDHRLLLPAAGLFGAVLVIVADIAARTAVAPAEIPIGIITAILGGPFFLWLLVRHRRRQVA